jgi:hypothetical protein
MPADRGFPAGRRPWATITIVTDWTSCPGCGLRLPPRDGPSDHRVNASPKCLQAYAEVVGFASQHLPLFKLHCLGSPA